MDTVQAVLIMLSVTIIVFGVKFVLKAFRVFQEIQWIRAELKRALWQIESNEEDQVIAGIQILSALGGQRFLGPLRRIEHRWQHNPRIQREARAAIENLLYMLDRQAA